MKSSNKHLKFTANEKSVSVAFVLLLLSGLTAAQDQDSTQTLFKSSVKVSELWTPEVKINKKFHLLVGSVTGSSWECMRRAKIYR